MEGSNNKEKDIPSKEVDDLLKKLTKIENRDKFTEVEEEIDQFYTTINASIENGMFEISNKKSPKTSTTGFIKNLFGIKKSVSANDPKETSENNNPSEKGDTLDLILSHIGEARRELTENNIHGSEHELSSAKRIYIRQLNQTPRRWKFSNIYAGYAWIFLVSILVGIFAIFYFGIDLEKALKVKDPAINATTWGVIGAVLRAMWFLKSKVDTRTYKNSYNVYFISVPFLGGILGAVIYLILLGGLFALQGNAITTNGTNPTGTSTPSNGLFINPLTIIPFAALAGYNWEWAVKLFNRLGDFLMDEDSNKSTKEQKRKKEI